jgi:hypothetical protein
MKHYEFEVILSGCGDTAEEAWNDACASIAEDGLGEFDESVNIVTESELNVEGSNE